MGSERLLLNLFNAYPVGHAGEALHYCHGYHAADPDRVISVVLNAQTPVRLYPCFAQFGPLSVIDDGPDGPRAPSMSRARILDDLDAIAAAAVELVEDRVAYEQALSEYFSDLLRAHRDDRSPIWSIDDVNADYIRGREEI